MLTVANMKATVHFVWPDGRHGAAYVDTERPQPWWEQVAMIAQVVPPTATWLFTPLPDDADEGRVRRSLMSYPKP